MPKVGYQEQSSSSSAKESVQKSHEKLAQATAVFYPAIINIILSNIPISEKDKKFTAVAQSLPPHLKPLVLEGFERFKVAARYNAFRYEKDKQLGRTLYNCLLQPWLEAKKPDSDKLLDPDGKITGFQEQYPGIPVLFLRDDIYKIFQGEHSKGITYLGRRSDITFIFFPDSIKQQPDKIKTAKHEVHHLVWHFLENSNFVRESNETDPQTNQAFDLTRTELAGYLFSEVINAQSGKPQVENVCYSKDPEILRKTQDIINLINYINTYFNVQNIDPKILLYPIMKSRNYDELKHEICNAFPLRDLSLTAEQLDNFFRNDWRTFSFDPEHGKAMAEVFRTNHLVFDLQEAGKLVTRNLEQLRYKSREAILTYWQSPHSPKAFLEALMGKPLTLSNDLVDSIFTHCRETS